MIVTSYVQLNKWKYEKSYYVLVPIYNWKCFENFT